MMLLGFMKPRGSDEQIFLKSKSWFCMVFLQKAKGGETLVLTESEFSAMGR